MPVEARQAADIIGAILRASVSAPTGDSLDQINKQSPGEWGHLHSPTTFGQSNEGVSSPVEGGQQVNSPYGPRGGGFHGGVDLNAPTGTTILAANSGTVTHAASDDPNGYGTWVEITGDDGVVTRYGHLSGMHVTQGNRVNAGAVIGVSGETGNARGAHLHFEVRQNGAAVDPMPFLAGSGQILSNASPGEDLGEVEMAAGSDAEVAAAQLQNVEDTIRGNPASADPLKPTMKLGDKNAPKGTVSVSEDADAETLIRAAMAVTGVDESWYEGLYARMMQESGGRNVAQEITDINTEKGTPAFGPMQVIEPTFRAHAAPGYEDWHNPLHNTIAAIRYIQSRYGHPSKLPSGGY
jgi:hypothetical protein